MSNRKTIGTAFLVTGVMLVFASLTADMVGFGETAGFGYRQIVGTVAGIVVAVAGYALRSRG
jgi:hypothetical protein